MYDELYTAWRFELDNTELGSLPSDFYTRVAAYLRTIVKETRMIDKKTVKSKLLKHELERVKSMLKELVWTRYKKLVSLVIESQELPSALLTNEEESLCMDFVSFAESYQNFADKLLRGKVSHKISKAPLKEVRKRVVLRFIKTVPKVIGADMKTYGPFMVEDVASVPMENAKILIKKGFAEKVELP